LNGRAQHCNLSGIAAQDGLESPADGPPSGNLSGAALGKGRKVSQSSDEFA
jgi:hypothetical protein